MLDTNIVSEMMRPDPNSNVISWLNEQQTPQLFLSSIAEVWYGLYVLPEGKRKQQLQLRFEQFTKNAFSYRILDFTEQAAKNYARVMGDKHHAGRPMSVPDGQIAAISLANGFALATRNIKDFEDCGVELLNPFEG